MHRRAPAEPLMNAPFPDRPELRLATDVLEYEGQSYIVVTDYFSRYLDRRKLETTDSESIIRYFSQLFQTLSSLIKHHTLRVIIARNSSLNGT